MYLHLYNIHTLTEQLGVSMSPKGIWHGDWSNQGSKPPTVRWSLRSQWASLITSWLDSCWAVLIGQSTQAPPLTVPHLQTPPCFPRQHEVAGDGTCQTISSPTADLQLCCLLCVSAPLWDLQRPAVNVQIFELWPSLCNAALALLKAEHKSNYYFFYKVSPLWF